MSNRFSLGKHERIKSRELMTRVFEEGQSIFSHPFKLIYAPIEDKCEESTLLKFGVTVPKKIHNKAVRRNKIKRLVREAYRHAKPDLASSLDPGGKRYSLMYIYVSKDVPKLISLKSQMEKLHRKWLKSLAE